MRHRPPSGVIRECRGQENGELKSCHTRYGNWHFEISYKATSWRDAEQGRPRYTSEQTSGEGFSRFGEEARARERAQRVALRGVAAGAVWG